MKKMLLLLVMTVSFMAGTWAQSVKVYNERTDAMHQIDSALVEAQASGRYVMCQVGGNWCPWCLRFAEFARTDSVIAPLMAKNFVYIHVNYSSANKNLEAMRRLGNPGRFGYPAFVVLNDKGELIHIQESESLEEGKGYSRKRVERFLNLWAKPAVEAQPK
ncbi:MAG: thioredoxin family protein [Bacteroidales bacterium]|nr:thioredoxin family protein [Bacteroidales bacterium]